MFPLLNHRYVFFFLSFVNSFEEGMHEFCTELLTKTDYHVKPKQRLIARLVADEESSESQMYD